jgi:hypothetical protein
MVFSLWFRGRLEHPAGEDVLRHQRGEVGLGEHAVAVGKQARGLAQARSVERVAHAARVGEVRLLMRSSRYCETPARWPLPSVVLRVEHLLEICSSSSTE